MDSENGLAIKKALKGLRKLLKEEDLDKIAFSSYYEDLYVECILDILEDILVKGGERVKGAYR